MIPEETREWLKSIGAREFKDPMKWHDQYGNLFSEEYLRVTPLDKIQAGYESTHQRMEIDPHNHVLPETCLEYGLDSEGVSRWVNLSHSSSRKLD